MLSKHAPSIEIATLCVALVAAWTDAPAWLPNGLALVVGFFALLLFAARVRRHEPVGAEEGSAERSWLSYELAGKGTPSGYYILAFFALVTIVLTGFDAPYASPAWAALVLGLVWGLANRQYPADEEEAGV
jgi:hypothetical protein